MTTDFRALCAELVELSAPVDSIPQLGERLQKLNELAGRARALLNQPEPEPVRPTAEELLRVAASAIAPYKDCGIAVGQYEPETEPAIQVYGSELIAFARAVLARWGRPTPQPPVAGEVAAALIELRSTVMGLDQMGMHVAAQRVKRAADLLQHQHPQPVAVSERLPEPSVKVLAHYFNALGKGRTICAIWVPAKSRSDEGDLDADDFLEYDEENDKYHWPEGWYEAIENWEELGWAKVYEGEIVYWQPLPQWPANALPTPEPNAQ